MEAKASSAQQTDLGRFNEDLIHQLNILEETSNNILHKIATIKDYRETKPEPEIRKEMLEGPPNVINVLYQSIDRLRRINDIAEVSLMHLHKIV